MIIEKSQSGEFRGERGEYEAQATEKEQRKNRERTEKEQKKEQQKNRDWAW
jgi:hypothetical protein